jgi:hypothetical protein
LYDSSSREDSMQTPEVSKGKHIAGWIITGLVSALFLFGAVTALHPSAETIAATAQMGYDASAMPIMGVLILICVLLYLIPRTSVLGAVLFTAYLGGAVATHIRLHQNGMAFSPVVVCCFVWLGIYLREPRLHHVLPVRR